MSRSFSSCGVRALELQSSLVVGERAYSPQACGIFIPWPGLRLGSLALEGRFLTPGPLGKSPGLFLRLKGLYSHSSGGAQKTFMPSFYLSWIRPRCILGKISNTSGHLLRHSAPRSPLSQLTLSSLGGLPGRASCGWAENPIWLKTSFPGGSEGKASACNAETWVRFPRSGRPPGGGNGSPLQHSCLENPMDGEAWCNIQSRGCKELDTTERLHFHFFSLSFRFLDFLRSDKVDSCFSKYPYMSLGREHWEMNLGKEMEEIEFSGFGVRQTWIPVPAV